MIIFLYFGQYVPGVLLLLVFCHALYNVKKQWLPIQFYVSDIWSAIISMTPGMYSIAHAFSDVPKSDSLILAWLVLPYQVLGICSARMQYSLSYRTRWSSAYVLVGSALGLAMAYVTFQCYEHALRFTNFHLSSNFRVC